MSIHLHLFQRGSQPRPGGTSARGALPALLLILLVPLLGLLLSASPSPAFAQSVATGTEAPYADDTTPAEPAWSETPYSWIRTVEGPATLVPGDDNEAEAVRVHLPVLVGDRLLIPGGSRLEVVLSDGNVLRLGGDTEILFQQVAGAPEVAPESPAGEDGEGGEAPPQLTVLRLVTGEIQLEVTPEAHGDELPVVETTTATVYVNRPGSYRVSAREGTTDGAGSTRVIVREGNAEVVSDRGSLLVRPGEQTLLESGEYPRAQLAAAPAPDALEDWGHQLTVAVTRRAEELRSMPLEDDLIYAAAPLAEHGEWLTVDGRRYWRPRVGPDWQPYVDGHWRNSPLGYFWVSYEPWGWVPYHYGSWSYEPVHGWIWYPGHRFATAWVYWYWGPSHVAWIPYGYYGHHGHRGHHSSHLGIHFGGHHRHFRHWVFVDHHHFHRPHLRHHVVHGDHFPRHTGRRAVPRGRVSPDSRDLIPAEHLAPRRIAEHRRPENRGGLRNDARHVDPRRLHRRDVAGRAGEGDGPGLSRRLRGDPTPEPGRRPAARPGSPRGNTDPGVTARRIEPRAGPGESRRPTTRRTAPRRVEPRRIDPRRAEPRRVEPHRDSRHVEPRRSDPRIERRRESPEARRVTPRSSPRTDRPTTRSTPRSRTTERPTTRGLAPRRSTPRRAEPESRGVSRRASPRADRPTTRPTARSVPRHTPPRRATPNRATSPRPTRATPRRTTPRRVTPSTRSTPRRPSARPSSRSSARSSRPSARRSERSSSRPRVRAGGDRPRSRAGASRAAGRRSSGVSRGGSRSRSPSRGTARRSGRARSSSGGGG